MRRPGPEQVDQILGAMKERGAVYMPDLVRAIMSETNVSRATAYRAANDAIKVGVIGYEESDGETETP